MSNSDQESEHTYRERGARRLAVLIDAENMPANNADAIFDEIAKFGDASVRRLYGDIEEGSVRPWMDKLAPLSIAPFHQPKNTVGKNASDIALVIDAMDLLLTGRFDGFVLVSSDSDFTKLAQRIREHSVDVWGFGKKNTPAAFRMACKQFISVENLHPASSDSIAPSTDDGVQTDLNHAYQLISNVLSQSFEPGDWVPLSWLGSQLRQRYSDFDVRSYGCRGLSDLAQKTGRFEESKNGTVARIRLRQKKG